MNSLIDMEYKQLTFNDKNVFIILDEENNRWFKGKDVPEIIECKDTDDSIRNHADIEEKLKYKEINRPKLTSFNNSFNL